MVYAPLSREHWNDDPVSVEAKTKLTLLEFVGLDGPLLILVSGGVRSIRQLYVARVASVFPAASVACTLKV